MASLKIRAKRAVRRQAAAASVRLPRDRGPEGWQQLLDRARVAEAKRRLVVDRDTAGALDLLDPYLHDDDLDAAPRAWTVAAEVHERAGALTEALAAARRAVAAVEGPALFEARLVHLRIAEAVAAAGEAAAPGDPAVEGPAAEVRAARAALLGARPRNRREVLAVFEALRRATPDDVRRFHAALLDWGLAGFEEEVAETHAELEIVAAAADDLPEILDAVTDRLRRPLPVVARALDRRRDWALLADYADTRIANGVAIPVRRAPALELRRAASRALTAGYTGPAQRLAGHALARHPDERYAQQTWANATDQLSVVRDGWPAPRRAEAPIIEPRPDAVLALLAQSLPHRSGGYATRSHGLLTGLRGDGWDVEAVTRLGFPYDRWSTSDPRRVEPSDEVDGVRYHRVLDTEGPAPYPQYPLARYVERYADAVVARARVQRPALLHASSFHVNGLAARAAAARLGLPYVYEMRGLEDLMKVSRDPGFAASDRQRFLDTVELASSAGAERVFVITEALRREMAARGVPEEKLVVLPNGVHTALFEPRGRDAALEAELGLAGRTVIGYAGSMVDYEGLELLLEAVAALRAVREDFHLLVVGDGPHEGVVRATAARLGLDGAGAAVTFTGRVPHAEVGRYLSLVDIAPFPRRPLPVCELISPIKPFESMAMGKAVVVSSVAALTEIVADGETGLVFEKGSAASLTAVLTRLLDDPELRTTLGGAARDWVRRERDWAHLVGVLTTEYEAVLGRSRRSESPAAPARMLSAR
ncbi:hypothetical protein GCM10022215_31530 [Nocardioides fonticola]|uniref:Glycosyltransferase subfamily 4-like N-terminal domain-containing protein n=1 Tax=Nocardioides fonticola TaxID=450363 RepID=A0ABP7XRL8_9ACTN